MGQQQQQQQQPPKYQPLVNNPHNDQLEKVLCDGEEVQLILPAPKIDQVAIFVLICILMTLILGSIVFMESYVLIATRSFVPSAWLFGCAYLGMVSYLGYFLATLRASARYYVVSNYRVMSVALWKKQAAITCMPHVCTGTLEQNTSSLTIKMDTTILGNKTVARQIVFKSLTPSQIEEAITLINANKAAASDDGTKAPCPRLLSDYPPVEASSITSRPKFITLMNDHYPVVWSNKQSRWTNWRSTFLFAIYIGLIVSYQNFMFFDYRQVLMGAASMIFYVLIIALIQNKLCAVNALSLKSGLVFLRTGLKLVGGVALGDNATVIPFRQAFPFTAHVSLQDNKGHFCFLGNMLRYFEDVSNVREVQNMLLAGAIREVPAQV
eukprot:TRINITY_DN8458_c0_g1_i1.p1 TRINITY_DN8458_c0_g1~~TRINITY_DN8458_c0_g1_i1.p1  ORF type:complete len:381 (-),score=88.52 TRINITY_DN8458_c0_g1_i1:106-1248(-)